MVSCGNPLWLWAGMLHRHTSPKRGCGRPALLNIQLARALVGLAKAHDRGSSSLGDSPSTPSAAYCQTRKCRAAHQKPPPRIHLCKSCKKSRPKTSLQTYATDVLYAANTTATTTTRINQCDGGGGTPDRR
jgi:hypothetical protein